MLSFRHHKCLQQIWKNLTFFLLRNIQYWFFLHTPTDELVLADVRRLTFDPDYTPSDPRELCSRLLVTCYMGTVNSSEETRQRAEDLANQIGRYVTPMGVRDPVSFRGAEVSCPNIFYIACPKNQVVLPEYYRLFCPKMAI